MTGKRGSPMARFLPKLAFGHNVLKGEPCVLWTAGLTQAGYGGFTEGQAHRWAYLTFVGPVPKGLVLDHLCRDRRCVNPRHLDLVTLRVNSQRGERGTRPYCQRGHWYTPATLYVARTGRRQCRVCRSEARRIRLERLTPEERAIRQAELRERQIAYRARRARP